MLNAMERFKLRQLKTAELNQKTNEEIPKPLDISSMKGTDKYIDILKEYALKNAYDVCSNENFSEKDTENYIVNVKKDIDKINIENADTAYLKCINKIFNIVGNANFRYKYENKRKEILENKQKIETNNIVSDKTEVKSEEKDFQLISEKAEKIFANADRKLEKIKKKFKLHDQKKEEHVMGTRKIKEEIKMEPTKKIDFVKVENLQKTIQLTKKNGITVNLVNGYPVKNKKTNTFFIVKAGKVMRGDDGKFYNRFNEREKYLYDEIKVKEYLEIIIKNGKTGKDISLIKDIPSGLDTKNKQQLNWFINGIIFRENLFKKGGNN